MLVCCQALTLERASIYRHLILTWHLPAYTVKRWMNKHRSTGTSGECLPVSASSKDPLSVVLSKDDSDGASVARHIMALAYHKLDQAPTPHQQAAIL